MPVDLATIKLGLIFFWALWLTIVFLTNLLEGLKVLGILPQDWPFASGNYAYVSDATDTYALPGWVPRLLFLGVILWEGLAVALFWRGLQSFGDVGRAGLVDVTAAFGVTLALWAAFMLADEIFRTYRQQTIHMLLFIGQLLTFLTIYLLD